MKPTTSRYIAAASIFTLVVIPNLVAILLPLMGVNYSPKFVLPLVSSNFSELVRVNYEELLNSPYAGLAGYFSILKLASALAYILVVITLSTLTAIGFADGASIVFYKQKNTSKIVFVSIYLLMAIFGPFSTFLSTDTLNVTETGPTLSQVHIVFLWFYWTATVVISAFFTVMLVSLVYGKNRGNNIPTNKQNDAKDSSADLHR